MRCVGLASKYMAQNVNVIRVFGLWSKLFLSSMNVKTTVLSHFNLQAFPRGYDVVEYAFYLIRPKSYFVAFPVSPDIALPYLVGSSCLMDCFC